MIPSGCEIRQHIADSVCNQSPVVAVLEALAGDSDVSDRPVCLTMYVCRKHADMAIEAIAYKPMGILTYLWEFGL